MAQKGIGASFKIDSAINVLTDVSGYLRQAGGSSTAPSLDATVFQPNVAAPVKTTLYGPRERTMSLIAVYTPAAFTFFAAIEGLEGQDYEYGPEGSASGDQKISGLANVGTVSLPSADVDGIETFTIELTLTSQVVGTY